MSVGDQASEPQGRLTGSDADVMHRLVADWQLLADLSFADLLLLVPLDGDHGGDGDGDDADEAEVSDAVPSRFAVTAQIRPTTGPTAYQEDLVGTVVTVADRPQLLAAYTEGRIAREGDPVWLTGVPIREEAIPVRSQGRVVAVVTRDTNLAATRTPSRLEIAYLQSAGELAQMLAAGTWPEPDEGQAEGASGPRVGDGLVRLDVAGRVTFASPNALSAYRRLGHLGDLVGRSLTEVTEDLVGRSTTTADEPVSLLTRGLAARSGDVEAADAIIALRALPLRPEGRHIGAVVLVHDVTELRRRERLLLSKDATIREIHHRVKNNLQTVAALLRLQARRMSVPEARDALAESVRRVSSIAVVHETLSGTLEESVDFDAVADRVLGMVADVAASPVVVRREGEFGVLDAEVATPLAMVLTELVQNAVEHGFDPQTAGSVTVRVQRDDTTLRVAVVDDGRGLPEGFAIDGSQRLGLQIVRTLVETELGGRLSIGSADTGGTAVVVETG